MPERKSIALHLAENAPPGTIQARFSTFGVLDKQRDIVKRAAFADLDGAEVPLIWSHEWQRLPVGKGHIRVTRDAAVFDGAFHLQTQWSRDAYETVKAMGSLQEYSYGFEIAPDGWTMDEHDDGGPVRIIHKIGRVFEVSPVLVGAGEQTATLGVKQLDRDDGPPPEGFRSWKQFYAESEPVSDVEVWADWEARRHVV
jgi:HK97 family phage prohead protease